MCATLSPSDSTIDRLVGVDDLRLRHGRELAKAIHEVVVRRGHWQPNGAFVMVRIFQIREETDTMAFPLEKKLSSHEPGQGMRMESKPREIDMSDIRGQAMACAAAEIAAAGGHNVLLIGKPSNGQSLLAHCLATILPEMTHDEKLEITNIQAEVGLPHYTLVEKRPLLRPHPTVNEARLRCGGTVTQPGVMSLAHNGVLYLEELTEFPHSTLLSLQEPLENGTCTIVRGSERTVRLASFLLMASAKPCPCGWLGTGTGFRTCYCNGDNLESHRARMRGVVLDHMDLQALVLQHEPDDGSTQTPYASSEVVRDRVAKAQARQMKRLEPWGVRTNAEMSAEAMRATCALDAKGENALAELRKSDLTFTEDDIHRLVRVARTIADLREQESIDDTCLLEAAKYRVQVANPATDGPPSKRPLKKRPPSNTN